MAAKQNRRPGLVRNCAPSGDDDRVELASTSHRRRDPVAADIDAIGFQRAVVLLHRAEDDDLRTRLQFGLVAGDEGDDGVPSGTTTFFSPSLYLTRMFWPSVPFTVWATVALVMVEFGR